MFNDTEYVNYMKSLPTITDQIAKHKNQNPLDLPLDIPTEASAFYRDFGYMEHPKNRDKHNRPLPVKKLANYQLDFWNHQGNILAVKPNKIGLTTSALIEDFQRSILPQNVGGQVLIGAQDQDFANRHIERLKMMIKASPKYHNYLIEKPEKELLREMKSKVSIAVIRNPYNNLKPSYIIGIGQNPSRTFSWDRVVHIHLSDISLIARKDWKEYWKGIYSRTANTEGFIKIESIPKGQQGLIWQLWKNIHGGISTAETVAEKETFIDDIEEIISTFYPMLIDVKHALKAGIITEAFLARAKLELGELAYQATFEGKFLAPGNQWYKENWFTVGGFGLK